VGKRIRVLAGDYAAQIVPFQALQVTAQIKIDEAGL
jgi:hypothetical protein